MASSYRKCLKYFFSIQELCFIWSFGFHHILIKLMYHDKSVVSVCFNFFFDEKSFIKKFDQYKSCVLRWNVQIRGLRVYLLLVASKNNQTCTQKDVFFARTSGQARKLIPRDPASQNAQKCPFFRILIVPRGILHFHFKNFELSVDWRPKLPYYITHANMENHEKLYNII